MKVVIPIGRFSYFIQANVRNIRETAGDEAEILFLTGQDASPEVAEALRQGQGFQVEIAPFTCGENHLLLLDWAVRKLDLGEWFITKHCDLFWTASGWLKKIQMDLEPSKMVVCVHCPSHFDFRGKNINIVGDFLGVYRQAGLLELDLRFQWGILGKGVQVSSLVAKAIESGDLRGKDGAKIVFGQEFLDGSQAMGWELAVRGGESVKVVQPYRFVHLVAFFRIAERMKREGVTLSCSAPSRLADPMWRDAFTYYSYLSSFCIELEEVWDEALPWTLFLEMARAKNLEIGPACGVARWLQGYATAREVVGRKHLGLWALDLNGERHSSQGLFA